MAIYKRGSIYWYEFTFNGEAIRESTRQKNQIVARNMESAHRTSLAKGLVGIREKRTVPTLKEFCERRFKPWAQATLKILPEQLVLVSRWNRSPHQIRGIRERQAG